LQALNYKMIRKRFYITVLATVICLFSTIIANAAVYSDSLGRKIELLSPPKRIISLAPSITEILYFLGLGDRLVGVTMFSYYPEEAKEKPKVGSYSEINIESVITLDPDLVIGTADGNKRSDVEMIEEAGIPVYIINPKNIDGVLHSIEKIGEVCGVNIKTKGLVSDLRQRIRSIQERVKSAERPIVLLVINMKPVISVGPDTMHNDLISLSGGRNMITSTRVSYPKISMEEIIKIGPDVILLSSMERGGQFEKAKRDWLRWPTLPAVQKGNVYLIDSDLIDRASPRIIKGLEEMAKLIHPEIKWNESE
jgi:iron complex transport system substrate-binding protein